MDFTEFYKRSESFLKRMELELSKNQIELLPRWQIDHICYRVDSWNQYTTMIQFAHSIGSLLIESDVNGRPISTFKLEQPIRFRDQSISVLEIPAPKPNKKVEAGFEHIEVVVDISFADIQEKYAHLEMNTKGLQKTINKELAIQLDRCAIKFHHQSLEEVIEIEKRDHANI